MTNEVVKEFLEKYKERKELGDKQLEKQIELESMRPQLGDVMSEVCSNLDLVYSYAGASVSGDLELAVEADCINIEELSKLEKSIGLPVKSVRSMPHCRISVIFKFE